MRDYVFMQEERRAVSWLGTTSPFNVAAEAASLGPFSSDEVEELLLQHTTTTGQRFEPEAAAAIYDLSQGHPWLVNALADRTVEHDDDVAYLRGLGLVRVVHGEYEIANPIYREVIPRVLTQIQQHSIHQMTEWYVGPDGALDVAKIMAAWQLFWREDGHLAALGFGYRESGPHLMLMAFLQRIVNGGGRIDREYGLGRGAVDLVIGWRGKRHAIEVKLRRDTQTEKRALAQVARYLDTLGFDEGWLITFDLRAKRSWKQRLTSKTAKAAGKRIHVIGC